MEQSRKELEHREGKEREGIETFISEIIWRDFYFQILDHFPNVEKESFKPEYRALSWENREDYFEAWKNGKTGYPIVDAAMRQLNQTGWMHNRLRMIVASFLTKDLLIDWRWGKNTLCKNWSMETWQQIMVAGNGQRQQERMHSLTFGYLIQSLNPKSLMQKENLSKNLFRSLKTSPKNISITLQKSCKPHRSCNQS